MCSCDDQDLYTESDEQPATAPRANLGANKISHGLTSLLGLRRRPPRCTRHSAPCAGGAPARRTTGARPGQGRPGRGQDLWRRDAALPLSLCGHLPPGKGTLMMPLPDLRSCASSMRRPALSCDRRAMSTSWPRPAARRRSPARTASWARTPKTASAICRSRWARSPTICRRSTRCAAGSNAPNTCRR